MATGDEIVRALREALSVSPDNVPLRQHLAETLLSYGRFAEAEEEYRAALSLSPQALKLQTGLAKALFQQDKVPAAISIVEDIFKNSPEIIPAEVYLLYSRLLLRAGDTRRAAGEYLKALDADPAAADPTLAEQLGIRPGNAQSLSETYFNSEHPENEDAGTPRADTEEGAARLLAEDEPGGPAVDLERPTVTFADVGGMDALKDEIRMKIIYPMTHPELYQAYGKSMGGGILMYGPPGCGKTYLARATAGEVRANFLAVGISDILDMWLGKSERNLHEVFDVARRNRPCILFFDEVDALAASRSDMRHSAGRHVINQFLAELDGVKFSNEGVLILGATNAPWHLDTAFLRPGRFDRVIFVPPPDVPSRASILRVLLKGKPTREVDYDYLAKKLNDFSGADLRAVIDTAVEAKLREAMKKGIPAPLTTADLQAAAKGVKPTTKAWFASARNYAIYANQSGFYDDILPYLNIS